MDRLYYFFTKLVYATVCLFICMGIISLASIGNAQNFSKETFKITGIKYPNVKYYYGGIDGGLSHVTYWGIGPGNPYYNALHPKEQNKADKINMNMLHSKLFDPVLIANRNISGFEIAGVLEYEEREQTITFRLPDNWNSRLVVAGTPGLRNEYANEAVLAPWLLEAGYGFICSDKGLTNGMADMLSGKHLTQYWGEMMLDMALWARQQIEIITGEAVLQTYIIGLSNGGYQVTRALEIDHQRVSNGNKRLIDGGVNWSGVYWPDERVLDTDCTAGVSEQEYAAANNLIKTTDVSALTMGWAYDDDTITTPEMFYKSPPFPDAYFNMRQIGFSPESAYYWGYYNTLFDPFQHIQGLEIYKGVGYYNLVSFVYRADLRGDDMKQAAAYSCYINPDEPDIAPPLYDWLAENPSGGWTTESIGYALKNSNSGEFSAPLLCLHGLADGLIGLTSNAIAYKEAVTRYGFLEFYRLYAIANAGHVDYHADGNVDFDFNGIPGNEGMAYLLTPMQAYAQRTFQYLIDWVENGIQPPNTKTVPTDPMEDVNDPQTLAW
ncbi:MAG: hypothetical protein GY874_00210 [Desulfobacteraceae bacterium]|nr:hypothetical protein [Desulfobacteraceae bacterium]